MFFDSFLKKPPDWYIINGSDLPTNFTVMLSKKQPICQCNWCSGAKHFQAKDWK